ncbi:MAG: hypothetical protein HEEMFOPI_00181 [Holosporales bacterium]
MKKRSLTLFGHRTSIALEEDFWQALQEIAEKKQISVQKLIEELDQTRGDKNLSSNLRVYVLNYFKSVI